jgi:hypothetical protein
MRIRILDQIDQSPRYWKTDVPRVPNTEPSPCCEQLLGPSQVCTLNAIDVESGQSFAMSMSSEGWKAIIQAAKTQRLVEHQAEKARRFRYAKMMYRTAR